MRLFALVCSILVASACGGDSGGSVDASPADAGGAADAAVSVDAPPVPDAGPPDAPPADADDRLLVTAVDYPVIAHGGKLVITGNNLTGATAVTIGGVAHTNVSNISFDSVTVDEVDDSVPVGTAQALTVTTPAGTTNSFDVTVIHLHISELESDSPGADDHEYLEIGTGLASAVSLDGYVAVFYQGGINDTGPVLDVFDLAGGGAMTNADGLFVIGSDQLGYSPEIVDNGGIQNGEDAVAIYQFAADPSSFPLTYQDAGNVGLIDALVYETATDANAPHLWALMADQPAANPPDEGGPVVDEGPFTAARDTVTIQRCATELTRRTSSSYRLEIPTPGRPNMACGAVGALATCTIDFAGTCPDTTVECGALFVAHGGGQCENIGVANCTGTAESFHTLAADERIDIFFSGNVNSLQALMALYNSSTSNAAPLARMSYYDIDGNPVGTAMESGTDCSGAAQASQTGDLGGGSVRRIQIEVTGAGAAGDLSLDDFQVNP